MRTENELARKLTRARTQLLLTQPFFGSLCLRLKLMPGPVPTMATNGRLILYNPGFVASLTPAKLEAVLAHEVMHCALAHHCRRGLRDPIRWNIAADLAINPLLVANGFTLPAGALIDPAYNDLSAEEIYARLPEDAGDPSDSPEGEAGDSPGSGSGSSQQPSENFQPGTHGSSSDRGGCGEVLDAADEDSNPLSPAENSRQQQEWSIAATQAMQSAKMRGNAPGNLERPLREARDSKQDWRTVLRDFVAATTPSDYRWTPPNRRFVASGLYLPSVARSGIGRIVIGVDTSGSIGTRELEQFAGEIQAIADEAKPEAILVVYCDAEVQSVEEFSASDPIMLEPKGGGGTDFRPVFAWIEQNGIEPDCVVYLTDLCCEDYPEPPAYPVLWATDSRLTAPFGETIQISVE